MQQRFSDATVSRMPAAWVPSARTTMYSVADLHARTGCLVRVDMASGEVFTGIFRTEILSAHALSVFISGPKSATLTIDEIVGIDSL